MCASLEKERNVLRATRDRTVSWETGVAVVMTEVRQLTNQIQGISCHAWSPDKSSTCP